jgi:hypothetical protein
VAQSSQADGERPRHMTIGAAAACGCLPMSPCQPASVRQPSRVGMGALCLACPVDHRGDVNFVLASLDPQPYRPF